jgi:hypothetical protein
VRSSGDLWDAPNLARGMRHKSEKDWERFLQTHELPRFFVALADQSNAGRNVKASKCRDG